jgi:Tol biopolymer transport system component
VRRLIALVPAVLIFATMLPAQAVPLDSESVACVAQRPTVDPGPVTVNVAWEATATPNQYLLDGLSVESACVKFWVEISFRGSRTNNPGDPQSFELWVQPGAQHVLDQDTLQALGIYQRPFFKWAIHTGGESGLNVAIQCVPDSTSLVGFILANGSLVACTPPVHGSTHTVGYAPDGAQFVGTFSRDPAVSRNGRIVAYMLDTEGSKFEGLSGDYVVVRDQLLASTTLIPIHSGGHVDVSADGKYVAFDKGANGAGDGVFVYNTTDQTITQVSPVQTTWSDPYSENPAISAKGRFVSFTYFTWVTPGNAVGQAYLRDMTTGQLTLVSATPTGAPGDGESGQTDVSANGRYVTFVSSATNLTDRTFVNHVPQVYVRDMWTGKTTLVSVSSSHVKANGPAVDPSISADGSVVAFASFATNLVPGDTNMGYDVFVRDRRTGTTVLGSLMPNGSQAPSGWETPQWSQFTNGPGWPQMLSDDGRYLALAGMDGNSYLRELHTGITTQVDVDDAGASLPGVEHVSVSATGRYVVFPVEDSQTFTSNIFIRGPLN